MNKRLRQLYSMIPLSATGVADIGTDHGIIPVQLALNGYPGRIFASDIAEAPLKGAVSLAEENRVLDRIRFAVSDGLDFCRPEWIDCILIAGMGGDSICRILDRAEWILAGEHTLILQPMTHPEVLRYWLLHNEFQITEEAVIEEEGHVYQMFRAEAGKCLPVSDAEYCAGIRYAQHSGDSMMLALRDVQQKTEKKLCGLRDAGQTNSSAYSFFYTIDSEIRDWFAHSFGTGEVSGESRI